jgi:hypothetical protein
MYKNRVLASCKRAKDMKHLSDIIIMYKKKVDKINVIIIIVGCSEL